MRAVLVCSLAIVAAACSERCKKGTVYLSYALINGAEAADTIDVALSVGGAPAQTKPVTRSTHGDAGSIEVDFGTYPSGQSLVFTLTALTGTRVLATAEQMTTANPGCSALSFTLDAHQGDLGGSDLAGIGSTDLAGSSADLAGIDASTVLDLNSSTDLAIPAVATARLIAPASTSTVTKKQPVLRWVLGPGGGTPVVDLCKDRACNVPLGVTATVSSNDTSAAPASALPQGWVYWRVRVVGASQTTTSATWQFWVGKVVATPAVDTSYGSVLDVNGDGYADFLIGASANQSSGAGTAHLYLGNASGTGFQRIDLTDPDDATAQFGTSVANAGDVNGDGYADFLVSAAYAASSSGAAHLYLGGATPSATDWNGATPAKRIDLADPDGATAYFGASVSGAGDVNGDGYADFLIGASAVNSSAGAAHVYFGAATPSATDWNGATPAKRIDLAGPDGATAYFGNPLSSAGDVNGDGYADFVIGAGGASSDVGAAHVYLGEATPDATHWNGVTPSKRIDPINPAPSTEGGFGFAVGSAGDVNGDGFADVVIGAPSLGGGVAHVYFGEATPAAADWNGAAPFLRVDLTKPDSAVNSLGTAATGVGDVDGDGYADFVLGAGYVGGNSCAAHLYLGKPTIDSTDWNGTTAAKRVDLTDPDDATANFANVAAAAGDVNGDGYSDFLVGAADEASYAGAAHLYLGEPSPSPTDWNGATPAKRIDFSGPDGANATFGVSLASAADIYVHTTSLAQAGSTIHSASAAHRVMNGTRRRLRAATATSPRSWLAYGAV